MSVTSYQQHFGIAGNNSNNNNNNNGYSVVTDSNGSNCATGGNGSVRLAGDNTKDRMYEPKHNKKAVRVLTVIAYIFFVSLAAIMLSLYYVFLWDPPPPKQLNNSNSSASPSMTDCNYGNIRGQTISPVALETPKAMPVLDNENYDSREDVNADSGVSTTEMNSNNYLYNNDNDKDNFTYRIALEDEYYKNIVTNDNNLTIDNGGIAGGDRISDGETNYNSHYNDNNEYK